ncbi:hypothetical protein RFI_08750 [Reticulomyxa filosa]|uniref:Protein kinase domain-containing protein n=1 Tax=Reticulomyxa filosa TaxID=46433 RepID=X6NSW8_RETFI|nr:hypothetical protein RFI_08750 [Reticulomyxa filosa]|eukprot:ETO28382.1 hypothetical protein RFI_08750 [Reticulomyxa filosa]
MDRYLVVPKMEMTLKDVIKSKQPLTNDHYLFFVYQILRGLKYIHSAGVVHRDLVWCFFVTIKKHKPKKKIVYKPENILVNCNNCNVKITDFGLARQIHDGEKLTEYVVTRWYRAPEVMVSAQKYDVQVDIWKMLLIMFAVLGTPQSDDLDWIDNKEALAWIQKLDPQPAQDLTSLFKKATPEAQDLVQHMLVLNPRKRITVVDALAHPYFVKLHDISKEVFFLFFSLKNVCKSNLRFHVCYFPLWLHRKRVKNLICHWKSPIVFTQQKNTCVYNITNNLDAMFQTLTSFVPQKRAHRRKSSVRSRGGEDTTKKCSRHKEKYFIVFLCLIFVPLFAHEC